MLRGPESLRSGSGSTTDRKDDDLWHVSAAPGEAQEAPRPHFEFLHTVEINRGRGPIKYVDSFGDAFAWFAACA